MSPLLFLITLLVSEMVALGFYAVYKKGDVHIILLRGKFRFEVDTKDRVSK